MGYRNGKRKTTSHTKPLESSCPLFLGNCGHGYQATSSPPTCGVCSSVADTSLCRPLGVAIVMLHSDMRSSLWWASSCVFCRQKEWLTPSSRPSPLLPTPNPGCINKDFSLSGQAWNLSQWKPQPPPPPGRLGQSGCGDVVKILPRALITDGNCSASRGWPSALQVQQSTTIGLIKTNVPVDLVSSVSLCSTKRHRRRYDHL